MRTDRNLQLSSSDDGTRHLQLTVPESWEELTQEQLRMVLNVLATFSPMEAKVVLLMRLCGFYIDTAVEKCFRCYTAETKEVFFLQTWQVQWCIEHLSFVDGFEGFSVRLDSIDTLQPVDELLHGVPFEDFLDMDVNYQLFLSNKEDTSYLQTIGRFLYRPCVEEEHLADPENYDQEYEFTPGERLNCFLWFSWVKAQFSEWFPNYFTSGRARGSVDHMKLLHDKQTQIRALTGGDITKEKEILKMDCWTALYELDAKAKEAADYKRKMKK